MYFPNPFRLYEKNREGAVGNITYNPPLDNIEKATEIATILGNLNRQGFTCIVEPEAGEIIQLLIDGKTKNEIILIFVEPCIEELEKMPGIRECEIDTVAVVNDIIEGKSKLEISKKILEECSGVSLEDEKDAIDDVGGFGDGIGDDKAKKINVTWNNDMGWMLLTVAVVFAISLFTSFGTQSSNIERNDEGKSFDLKFKMKNLFYDYGGLQIGIYIFIAIVSVFSPNIDRIGISETLRHLFIFFIIVGSTLLLTLIPSFVEVFENTIGYYVADKFKSDNPFDKFKNRLFPTVPIDLTFLLTCFHVENFSETFEKFIETACNPDGNKEEGYFNDIQYIGGNEISDDDKNDIKNKIFNMTVRKNMIGHFTWRFFSVLLATLVTYHAL